RLAEGKLLYHFRAGLFKEMQTDDRFIQAFRRSGVQDADKLGPLPEGLNARTPERLSPGEFVQPDEAVAAAADLLDEGGEDGGGRAASVVEEDDVAGGQVGEDAAADLRLAGARPVARILGPEDDPLVERVGRAEGVLGVQAAGRAEPVRVIAGDALDQSAG